MSMLKEASLPATEEQVETIGIAPIPEARRAMGPWMLFLIWALASASATTPVIGLILYHLGFTNLVWAIVLAFLIGLVPAALFSEMGRELPLISMVAARIPFGVAGAFLLSVLYTLVGAGWFGLNTDVGGDILSALFPGHGTLWYWLLGLAQTGLVFLGMKWLEYFYKYTAVIFIACYAVLTYYLFTHYPTPLPPASAPVHWGEAITTVLSFSLLAWAYEFSTVSRFCEPAQSTQGGARRIGYWLAAPGGVMLAVLLMGMLGIIAKAGTGEWNIALLGKSLPLWGEIAAVGVILAIAHTNAMNLYPAVTKLLAALDTVRPQRRLDQPIAALALGVIATILAVINVLQYVENFLLLVGNLLFPFTFIMVLDWVWVQRRATPPQAFFVRPRTPGDWLAWPARAGIVALIIGVGLSFAAPLLPAVVPQTVPWSIVSSLIACVIYLLLLRLRPDTARTGYCA